MLSGVSSHSSLPARVSDEPVPDESSHEADANSRPADPPGPGPAGGQLSQHEPVATAPSVAHGQTGRTAEKSPPSILTQGLQASKGKSAPDGQLGQPNPEGTGATRKRKADTQGSGSSATGSTAPSALHSQSNTRPPSTAQVNQAIQDATFHHVTAEQAAPSILRQGLLASHGGRGGAGEAYGQARQGNPRAQQRAQYYQVTSRNQVHISKGEAKVPFYEQVHRDNGTTPTTLSVYLPKERTNANPDQGGVRPDPVDGEEFTAPNGQTVPAAYQTNSDIPAGNIMPRHLEPTDPNTGMIRPPGTIGADYAPPAAINAVRTHLPGQSTGRTDGQVTEDIRQALHGGRINYPADASGSNK
jgi:hypothetical protein